MTAEEAQIGSPGPSEAGEGRKKHQHVLQQAQAHDSSKESSATGRQEGRTAPRQGSFVTSSYGSRSTDNDRPGSLDG